MSKKDQKEKEEEKLKQDEPFIIRREVILKDDKSKKPAQTEVQKKDTRSDLGKVQKKSSSQDYNIVYRERKDKPLSVSELFGLQPKPSKEEKVEKQERISSSDKKQSSRTVGTKPKIGRASCRERV